MFKFDSSLNRLRRVGILEAISFLLRLGVAMPLKYAFGHPEMVRIVGMAHGCFGFSTSAWLGSDNSTINGRGRPPSCGSSPVFCLSGQSSPTRSCSKKLSASQQTTAATNGSLERCCIETYAHARGLKTAYPTAAEAQSLAPAPNANPQTNPVHHRLTNS